MNKVLKILKNIIKNPRILFSYANALGLFKWLSDEAHIKLMWWVVIGTKLDLDNPRSFNEKLQWIKLYDRQEKYTMMADKYLVRNFIKEKIGEQYLVPLLGVWDKAEDIDFSELPNQFVLKCNHNSGTGMCFCHDKDKLNIAEVRSELTKGLAEQYYWSRREWVYKNIKPKIICEKFLIDHDPQNTASAIVSYKFYCFNGEPKFLYTQIDDNSSGKKGEALLTYRNLDWSEPEFSRPDHTKVPFEIKKPDCLDEMIELSRKLAESIPFVRVDWFLVDGKIYFSEMTFYPGSGTSPFTPVEWENRMGDWITLPKKKQ